jgi:hypothetical protein
VKLSSRAARPLVQHSQEQRAEVGLLIELREVCSFRRRVGKQDVIDVDMSPAPGRPVDDLHLHRAPDEFVDVPKVPEQLFVIFAGRSAHDLPATEQIDARLAGSVAAADAELNIRAANGEFGRGQRALRIVAVQKRIDESLAAEAAYLLLTRQRALRRLLTKSRSGRVPFPVGAPFEVRESLGLANFTDGRPRRFGDRHHQARQSRRTRDVVVPKSSIVPYVSLPDRILNPASQSGMHAPVRKILHAEAQNRPRRRRLPRVERDKRAKRLEHHFDRIRVPFDRAVVDRSDRIFPDEFNPREPVAIERAINSATAVGSDRQPEPLLDRRRRRVRAIAIVAVTGEAIDVEDAPLGQRAITAKIKLARADPADRHADAGQLVTRVDLLRAFGEQSLDPFRIEAFVRRDVMRALANLGRRRFTGAQHRKCERTGAPCQKITARKVGGATVWSFRHWP